MQTGWIISGLSAGLLLSACGPAPQKQAQNAAECRAYSAARSGLSFETDAEMKSYFNKVINGVSGADASVRSEHLACLDRVGELPAGVTVQKTAGYVPTSQREKHGSNVLSGGTGYQTQAYSKSTKSSAEITAAKPQKTAKGKLPLPTQYPLLAGDAALWPTLTLAEQQRALEFLATGSTIASSLKVD
jgi:hypothetical protein